VTRAVTLGIKHTGAASRRVMLTQAESSESSSYWQLPSAVPVPPVTHVTSQSEPDSEPGPGPDSLPSHGAGPSDSDAHGLSPAPGPGVEAGRRTWQGGAGDWGRWRAHGSESEST
jgi:hypothetical protein